MIPFLKSNKLIITILMIASTIYGLSALLTITKEATPSINLPLYVISTVYPGADPQTMDEQITNKLEQRLKTIQLVKSITSSSTYNISSITVEFPESKDEGDALNEIKSAVDQVYSSFPEDARQPIVRKVDFSQQSFYSFSVAGPYTNDVLYEKVKTLEDVLKSVNGVSEIQIVGKPTQEIRIQFDLQKINSMDIDVSFIINQLRLAFIKFPLDKKMVDGSLYSFEVTTYTPDLVTLIQDIRNFPISTQAGKSITVGDLAQVTLSTKQNTKKSFLMTTGGSINAISYQVFKSPGFDVQTVTDELSAKVKDYSMQFSDITFVETQTQTEIIDQTYNLFIENLRETALLVFIVILIFLGWKSSIIILVAFVLVYLMNFALLKAMGYNFNNIVSFSLILVLGIMVDNLIVITQGIVTGLKEHKWDIWKAIEFSLTTYGSAVLWGTMCTIVIFIPIIYGLSGVVGQFMRSFPIVIDTNLALSLLVSLIGLPIMFTLVERKNKQRATQEVAEPDTFEVPRALLRLEEIGRRFGDLYVRLNRNKFSSWMIMLVFRLFFVSSFFLFAFGRLKFDFLGKADNTNIRVNMQYPAGTTVSKNQAYTQEISAKLLWFLYEKYPEALQTVGVDVGIQVSLEWGGGWDTSNYAAITLKLTPEKEREVKSYILTEEIQAFIQKEIKGQYAWLVDISAVTPSGGPSSGKPISFDLVWEDLLKIGAYLAQIQPEIEQIQGTYNFSTNLDYTNGRFQYVIDIQKAKDLNVSTLSVVNALVGIKNSEYDPAGIKIKEFNEFGKEVIPATIYFDASQELLDTKIGPITLREVIKEVKLLPEIKTISRVNGEKTLTFQADKLTEISLGEIQAKVEAIIKKYPSTDVKFQWSSGVESQDESFTDLGAAFQMGTILMFLTLIILFKNLKYPVTILSSIFLSIWGTFRLLALLGKYFTFPAALGIFGVLGVGVNQAIIHIEDFMIFHDEQGMSVRESFRRSIALRFVPIFLTKLVTIIGLIILAFKDAVFGSLAIGFIGGLIVSFFITLLYLPTLITLTTKKRKGE